MTRPALRGAEVAGLGYAFTAMAAAMTLRTYCDAAFLSAQGTARLPHFFVASSLATMALSALYGAAVRRVRAPALDATLALAAAAIAFWAPQVEHTSPAAIFPVTVALIALSTIATLGAWNAVSACVDSRRARRFLPLAGAAATLGAATGGALATLLSARAGLDALPRLGALLAVSLAAFPWLAAARATTPAAAPALPAESPAGRAHPVAWADAAARRLVALLVAVALVESLVGTLIDFQLKAALRDAYGRDAMGVFLGFFTAVTNVGVLALQLFVVAPIFARRGLAFSLALHPIAVAAVAGAAVAVPHLGLERGARAADALLKFTF
ncbi:MAG: hypothetical protein AABZ30_15970, partial [Myxococcota bacterium]